MTPQRLDVDIPETDGRSYPIIVGSGLLARLADFLPLAKASSVAVVYDRNVPRLADTIAKTVPNLAGLVDVSPGESSKSPAELERIWKQFRDLGIDRGSFVLNVGGGMVGDLGGFAASTYMRGIAFAQIPTTLLAQVDASVGGKVGVNLGGVKNLVGSFAQPHGVVIDVQSLRTLPDRELRAGYAEVVKHAFIADRAYLEKIADLESLRPAEEVMVDLIVQSCRIKKGIVGRDPTEKNERKLLNFGHTVGHALETLSFGSTPLLHGEAVAIGMVAEARLSERLGLLTTDELEIIESTVRWLELPVRHSLSASYDAIRRVMASDKKNVGGSIRWTLLATIGSGMFDHEAPEEKVREAVEYVRNG